MAATDVEAENSAGGPANKKPSNKYEEEEKVADPGREENQEIRRGRGSQRGDTSALQKSHLSGISSVSGPDLLGGDTRDGIPTPTLERSGHDGAP